MKLMSDEEDILRHEERLLGRQFLSSEDLWDYLDAHPEHKAAAGVVADPETGREEIILIPASAVLAFLSRALGVEFASDEEAQAYRATHPEEWERAIAMATADGPEAVQ
jgi:hypothetical protein